MTDIELANWEREINHAAKMQEQRKNKTEVKINIYELEDENDESSNR